MKQTVKLILIMALSIAVYSCSNDNTELSNVNNFKPEIITTNADNHVKIDLDESPDLSPLKRFLQIEDIDHDLSRPIYLDVNNSILIVPYIGSLDNKNNFPIISYGLKIAKKNVKPGGKCKKCVDCIGFRCGFTQQIKAIDEVIANSVLDEKLKDLRKYTEREQDFLVFVNTKDKVLEFHSPLNLDWDKLN